MNAKYIADLQRRFGQIGLEAVSKEMGCELQLTSDSRLLTADFYGNHGKLSFVLDMDTDVDPLTLNMNTYTGVWQGVIQIEAGNYDGVNIAGLENRFRQFSYIADTGSAQAREMMEAIKAELRKLSVSKKPEAVRAYHHFLAKYGLQFNLGEPEAITAVRLKLQQQYTVTRRFSLQSERLVSPAAAYQQLAATLTKALKKR